MHVHAAGVGAIKQYIARFGVFFDPARVLFCVRVTQACTVLSTIRYALPTAWESGSARALFFMRVMQAQPQLGTRRTTRDRQHATDNAQLGRHHAHRAPDGMR